MHKDQKRNTDIPIWRQDDKDPRSPKVFATIDGAIGIEANGCCVIMTANSWVDAGSYFIREHMERETG